MFEEPLLGIGIDRRSLHRKRRHRSRGWLRASVARRRVLLPLIKHAAIERGRGGGDKKQEDKEAYQEPAASGFGGCGHSCGRWLGRLRSGKSYPRRWS